MLRAVRYEQRYGFQIEPRTQQLIDEARPLVARLSDERVRHELDLILAETQAVSMLARLDDLGLLKAISPELPWNAEIRERLDANLPHSFSPVWDLKFSTANPSQEALAYCLWLLDQPQGAIDSLHTRLRFPVSTLKAIRAAPELCADLQALRGAKASQWVDRLDGIPLLAIYAVYLASGAIELETYVVHWRNIHPFTTGDTLKQRGLPPGQAYQAILHTLRSAWLDGVLLSAADENHFLDELLK
jgi:tRNA nucleotidyltransferase (CCA-adding enzyme)